MSANKERGERLQVIFDGACGLCKGLVQWVLRRDRHGRLCFVPAGSEEGLELLARLGRDPEETAHTILTIVIDGQQRASVLTCSEAVLAVLKQMPPPWPLVAHAMRWIPLPLRDAGYRIVARSRYRIRGRSGICSVSAHR